MVKYPFIQFDGEYGDIITLNLSLVESVTHYSKSNLLVRTNSGNLYAVKKEKDVSNINAVILQRLAYGSGE